MPIAVNKDKCTACETCLISCPFEAIVMREGKAFINEYCNQCKVCLSVCPEGAIVEIDNPPLPPFSKGGMGGFEPAIRIEDYKDVLVFAEQRNGKVAPVPTSFLASGENFQVNLEQNSWQFY